MNVIFIVMLFAAFVVSICIHESAHALVALALGDPGPRNDGRISLNPLRQMAGMGTAVAIVLAFLYGGLGLALGWGKPVRFDALKLKAGPNFGTVLVALAGPLANLLLGVGGAFALQAIPQSPQFFQDITRCLPGETALQCVGGSLPWWSLRGEQLLFAFIVVNIGLFLINILPLYPLDGYRVVFALLPNRQAVSFRRAEPYMELIILGIIFLLPMLLQISGAPQELNPLYWIYQGINAIVFAIVNPVYVNFPVI
ncbi:MAG TPA: site-2 protease family protein [Ktedonobacterales bacterium]|nr:site-2 protease family protein [Ktedonobacterales bacterium]